MRYRLLLLAASAIWGSSFVMVKDITELISPAWLLVLRFVFASLIVALICLPQRALYFEKRHVRSGIIIGLALFMGYYLQTLGVTGTTPGKNAFLTAVYSIIVPFLAWPIMRRRPTFFSIVAAFIALAGIGFISLNGSFSMGYGDALSLTCSFFYALQIVFIARFAQECEPGVLTLWQFITTAVGSLVMALTTETPPDLAALPVASWVSLIYLISVVTVLGMLFQNIGQVHVPAAQASLLLMLESVFGAFFSVLMGAEVLSPQIALGFSLVFISIVVSEYLPTVWKRRRSDVQRKLPGAK